MSHLEAQGTPICIGVPAYDPLWHLPGKLRASPGWPEWGLSDGEETILPDVARGGS